MKDRYEIVTQRDNVRFYFKDQEVTPKFAKTLSDLGVTIHTERGDDWFWETFDE